MLRIIHSSPAYGEKVLDNESCDKGSTVSNRRDSETASLVIFCSLQLAVEEKLSLEK